jgi:hypothetical protein
LGVIDHVIIVRATLNVNDTEGFAGICLYQGFFPQYFTNAIFDGHDA